jgi:UDP-N-acetylmuramoylalanine--D-glutamate ligase
VFGLGGSGLRRRARAAGGRRGSHRPGTTIRQVPRHAAEGIIPPICAPVDWGVLRFVLSPGVPLTHPKPHWTVDLARKQQASISSATSSCSAASAGACARCAVHRHHRHQRQIDDDGADRAYPARAAAIRRWAAISAPRSCRWSRRPGRFYVIECSSYQIDLAPSLDPSVGILLNLTPDHLDRHGTMQHYADIKERLVAGSVWPSSASMTAIASDRRPDRAGRRQGDPHFPPPCHWRRIYAEGTKLIQATPVLHADRRPRWHPDAARQPQCAERGSGRCRVPEPSACRKTRSVRA